MPRKVSVLWELDEVRAAIDAARLLADQLRHEGFPDDDAAKLAPRAIAAVLNLASARLTQLGAVLRGDLGASWIRAAHNAVERDAVAVDPESRDVFLDAGDRRQP